MPVPALIPPPDITPQAPPITAPSAPTNVFNPPDDYSPPESVQKQIDANDSGVHQDESLLNLSNESIEIFTQIANQFQ